MIDPARPIYYILEGHTPVPVKDIHEWADRWEKKDRRVKRDELFGGIVVSTIFLGIDHSWDEGFPVLFETMIFGGFYDQYQTRCSWWEEAECQHAVAVRKARRWRWVPVWLQHKIAKAYEAWRYS